VQCDGYAPYKKLPAERITVAFCWSHLRREFFKIAERGDAPIATEAVARIAQIYVIEKDVRGTSADERRVVRQARSRPLVDALRIFFEHQLARLSGGSDTARIIRYGLRHWDGLTRFLDDGRIELDTNIVERSMRPQALTRKNALFAGHDDGAENWAIVASLIEACKLNDVEPQAYLADVLVRLVNLALYAIAGRRDPDFVRALLRFAPTAAIGPLLILAASFVEGRVRLALWVIAILALYSGPLLDRGQGWRLSPAHFAERYGLIVIIALGESIFAIGFATAGVVITPATIAAAVLGLAVIAALWWAYFDVFAVLAQQQLSATSGVTRARLARDCYSYLHMPMIAGIVLFALGLKITTHDVHQPLAVVPAVALCGGLSLYFFTHVLTRLRLVALIRRTTKERPGWIGPGRLAAAIGTLAAIPAAVALPALAALTLVAAVCWALIVWDLLHYREHRIQVREARP